MSEKLKDALREHAYKGIEIGHILMSTSYIRRQPWGEDALMDRPGWVNEFWGIPIRINENVEDFLIVPKPL